MPCSGVFETAPVQHLDRHAASPPLQMLSMVVAMLTLTAAPAAAFEFGMDKGAVKLPPRCHV